MRRERLSVVAINRTLCMRQRPPCRPPSPFLLVPSSAPPADMFENTVHRFPDPDLGSSGEAGSWSLALHLAHPTCARRLRVSCRGSAMLGPLASPSLGGDPSSLFSSLCSRTIWGRPPASWRDLGIIAGGLCCLPAARPWHMPPHPSLGFLICKWDLIPGPPELSPPVRAPSCPGRTSFCHLET